MVDIETVKAGVMSYMNSNVIPKLPPKEQFVAGVGMGVLASKSDALIAKLAQNPMLKSLDLVDGRMIDVDTLYHSAKEQINKQQRLQIDVPLVGKMTFYEPDLDTLYQSIVR